MAEERRSVVLYTTDPCGYCRRAKALLEARGIAFREVRLPRTAEGRARLADVAPAARTFPVVVIDGVTIGGYADLVDWDRAGRLSVGAG
ncbi:MAG TPA: glutaredoxin domain-containing protein [Gemmatimonadota bacterium]|nr:glutaredoxin domain-containing protein [Gemmatimonadota bacterium]